MLKLRLFLIFGALNTIMDKTFFCMASMPLLRIIRNKSLGQSVLKIEYFILVNPFRGLFSKLIMKV